MATGKAGIVPANVLVSFGNFFFGYIYPRWVAGTSRTNALSYAKTLNERFDSPATINYLGEHYRHLSDAKGAANEILELIGDIRKYGLKASVTIKPGQLGYNVENARDAKSFCLENMKKIAAQANKAKVAVWIDMENSNYTDFTLDAYRDVLAKYGNVGVCLQANLKRSKEDLKDLIDACKKGFPAKARLVKGIYQEPKGIAYPGQKEIHENYRKLISLAFSESEEDFGIAIASHHKDRINEALNFQKKYKKEFFQVQMLKGVMPGLMDELRKKGVNVCEYVPYGKETFAYSMRRAMKDPKLSTSPLLTPFIYAYRKIYGEIEIKR